MSVIFFLILGLVCGSSASLLYAVAGEDDLLPLLLVYALASMTAGAAGAGTLALRHDWTTARLSRG